MTAMHATITRSRPHAVRVATVRFPYDDGTMSDKAARAARAATFEAAGDALAAAGGTRDSMTVPEPQDGYEWRIYADRRSTDHMPSSRVYVSILPAQVPVTHAAIPGNLNAWHLLDPAGRVIGTLYRRIIPTPWGPDYPDVEWTATRTDDGRATRVPFRDVTGALAALDLTPAATDTEGA